MKNKSKGIEHYLPEVQKEIRTKIKAISRYEKYGSIPVYGDIWKFLADSHGIYLFPDRPTPYVYIALKSNLKQLKTWIHWRRHYLKKRECELI